VKKNKRDFNAYITLEATMIFPLILLVVLIFLFASFYLHDKTVLASEMHAFIDKYASSFDIDECDADMADFEGMLSGKMIMSDITGIEVSRNIFKISISATVSLQLPSIFEYMLNFGLFSSNISMSMIRMDRAEAARVLSVAAETACGIKGLGDLIQKVVAK
jgi:hypothetical protein